MNYPTELEVMPEAIVLLLKKEKIKENGCGGIINYDFDCSCLGNVGNSKFDLCDLCTNKINNLNLELKGQITQAKETLKEISRQIEDWDRFTDTGLDNFEILDWKEDEINAGDFQKEKLEQLNKRKKQYEVSIKFLEEQVK